MSTTSVKKTSISLKMNNRKRLQKVRNRSALINQALDLYFDKEQYMKEAEEKRLRDMAEEGLKDVREGNVYPLNPDGGEITNETLDKFLRNKK